MIAGHNKTEFLRDLKYNMTDEDYFRITASKKALENRVKYLKKAQEDKKCSRKEYLEAYYLNQYFHKQILPGIYNQLKGYEQEESFYTDDDDEDKHINSHFSKISDHISAAAKYEEGESIQQLTKGLYNHFKQYECIPPTHEEIEEETKELQRETKSLEDSEDPFEGDENPMKDMIGYKQLETWLNSLKSSTESKKKYNTIQKMSDLQKVSATEFVKPRALFMKKVINRELYCKQTVKSERYMYIMTDNSGSMGMYKKWRNNLMMRVYDDTVKLGIQFEHNFWNTTLHEEGKLGPQIIHSREELKEKVLNINATGDDTMGHCVMRKLELIPKRNNKQYLLCVSDGTGSLWDQQQRRDIDKLALEKNIELKYALFSSQNNMYDTKPEDMFYIYGKKVS